jgi:hypothetical protein
MTARRFAMALAALVGQAVAVTLAAAPASAGPPVGTCTRSYGSYTFAELLEFDPGAGEVASIVDANGNGVICFKWYPNGDHNGHLGNLVDDTAAPHD